ncbi:GntR family transcriptional regulator [Neobacillus sp. SAB-20_R2A]|uniref:GntR family transcriptional regulator n=1 Tax=Neobacillus sp. SAB-20_R2A TaxID=3120519 RepID=UPI003C6E4E2F
MEHFKQEMVRINKPDLRNLHEQTYQYLHRQIITNKLKPGTRINYEKLSKELGLSKTPLRDAFNRLFQEGLVEIKPRSGTFVSIPNIKDAKEVYEVRKALERQSVALAIQNIPNSVLQELLELNSDVEIKFNQSGDFQAFLESDRIIHNTIIKFSNNSRIINIMETLNAQISWFGYQIIDKIKERASEAMGHHKDILEAMADQNVELAMKLMEDHIEATKIIVVQDFS